jgi:hypothetical protein
MLHPLYCFTLYLPQPHWHLIVLDLHSGQTDEVAAATNSLIIAIS